MRDPLESKTITLSCGKLTTGVTIRPWSGIFMLRNLSSPETYFQAAFRVQSPWKVKRDDGTTEIVKKICYVFDFAIDRALKQISDYSCRLNVAESNPEKKVNEFIKFLPVLAYDGSSMRQVNAVDILDMAMSGTSATLLADSEGTVPLFSEGTSPSFEAVTAVVSRAFRDGALSCAISERASPPAVSFRRHLPVKLSHWHRPTDPVGRLLFFPPYPGERDPMPPVCAAAPR